MPPCIHHTCIHTTHILTISCMTNWVVIDYLVIGGHWEYFIITAHVF